MRRAQLRAARANRFFCPDNSNKGLGWGLSTIERGSSIFPPAYANAGARALRAPRANRVFGTDEKRIRTKNTVMDKGHRGFGLILSNKRNPAVDAGRDFNRHA